MAGEGVKLRVGEKTVLRTPIFFDPWHDDFVSACCLPACSFIQTTFQQMATYGSGRNCTTNQMVR